MSEPRVVRGDDLGEGQATAGMTRREAFSGADRWIGAVSTEPGAVSAWHHHGEHDTYVYCIQGALQVDSGPGGSRSVTARAGDFVHIPAGRIHRERNPSDATQQLIVARFGSGPVVVNVDGPED